MRVRSHTRYRVLVEHMQRTLATEFSFSASQKPAEIEITVSSIRTFAHEAENVGDVDKAAAHYQVCKPFFCSYGFLKIKSTNLTTFKKVHGEMMSAWPSITHCNVILLAYNAPLALELRTCAKMAQYAITFFPLAFFPPDYASF